MFAACGGEHGLFSHLNRHRYGTTTTKAEGSKTSTTATAAQFINQGGQDTGAAGANRMAQCNGSTIDVYSRPIPVEVPAVCQGLCGKGLVNFDQVKVANLEARAPPQAIYTPPSCGKKS